MSAELQQVVAQSADAADLHATVPTLLLELQTMLGSLTATVTAATERGRRPFRPTADLPTRLGELAYGMYLLADQTGIDLAQAVVTTATHLHRQAQQTQATGQNDWPFDAH
ncbi:MAG: hypothetical protein JWO57_696 [Pseudonocardiales bacterium]|nr:hypothetical protein [Pseudonocardiales bacterium]